MYLQCVNCHLDSKREKATQMMHQLKFKQSHEFSESAAV